MARADLLLALVQSGAGGDDLAFRRAAEALIAEEENKKHNVLALGRNRTLVSPNSFGARQESTRSHCSGRTGRRPRHHGTRMAAPATRPWFCSLDQSERPKSRNYCFPYPTDSTSVRPNGSRRPLPGFRRSTGVIANTVARQYLLPAPLERFRDLVLRLVIQRQ